MTSAALVVAGFALLFFGGDFLVRGAVELARRMGVSTLVISVTVVAFGTSLPELIVSLDAALEGVPTLAVGNIVGSNVANILLVLGLPAILAPVRSAGGAVSRNTAIMIAATLLVIALAWNGWIGFWEGLVMAVLLVVFLVATYLFARGDALAQADMTEELDQFESSAGSPLRLAGLIAGGLAALFIGAQLLITGAVDLARSFGISEAVIGLTLVAFGTSLPELVTAFVAVARKHADVAIGNILGSNLFNILGIMGVTAMVVDLPVPERILSFDVWVMLGAAVFLVPFVWRGVAMGRLVGLGLSAAYISYIWLQFSGLSGAAG